MDMTKEELIEVFEDTQNLCNNEFFLKTLLHPIRNTNVIEPNYERMNVSEWDGECTVKVTNKDTFTAAQPYAKMAEIDDGDTVVAVLNFASATNPGGGVTKGSSAQEEDLCRRSNLYPAISQEKCMNEYYNVNRKGDNLGSDKLIYTLDVLVMKDKDYKLLPVEDMFYVDVITCAAPNLRENPRNAYNQDASKKRLTLTDDELYAIHVKRAKCIFNEAKNNGVTHLILGAFGCGAFKNNPRVVAQAYRDVIKEFSYYFKVVEFAIVGKNDNFNVFSEILLGK